MTEIEQTSTQKEEERQKRIGLWAAAIFAILGLAFLIFWCYNVVLLQNGQADFSDKILLPVTILMFLAGLGGFLLIRRNRLTLGLWLIYLVVLVPPVIAVLVLGNIYVIAVAYLAVFAPISIVGVFPRVSRRAAIIAAVVALLAIAGIEFWKPTFRVTSTALANFAPFAIAFGSLGLLAFFAGQYSNFSLRTKFFLAFSFTAVSVMLVTALVSYNNLKNQSLQEFRRTATTAAALAALQQNGDEFIRISSAQDPLYEKFRIQNLKIRRSDPQFAYVYTMRKDEKGIYFVVDAGVPGEQNIAAFGDRYDDPSITLANNFDTMTAAMADSDIYTDKYGSFLSAYAPIFSADGKRVGIIGVDINAETIIQEQTQLLNQTLIIIVSAILLSLILGYFFGNQLTKPIVQLTSDTGKYAAGNFSFRTNILTKDEIGNLGLSFNNMADQIQALVSGLEQRVADRTKALITSTEVSRRLSTILDQKTLIKEVVAQLQSAFHYYHAHIYLLEAASGDLVLAGGTGEAGQVMLARSHRVPQGKGLVGRAAETKETILVPDTSKDLDWLPNPLLPETKSEVAVPILTGEQVLGVLDVQNNVVASLGQQDADLIGSIASQVAVALQNSSLYARAEASMQEAQSLVEYAPEAIVVVDLETGRFADPNDNAIKLYGLSREELVKVGPAQMSPPTQPDGRDSTEKALEKIGQAVEGKAPIFDWTHRNGQGQDIPCEVRLVRIPGERPRVRASVTNITERKRIEDLTRRRAHQQEALNLITQEIQRATTVEAALQITVRELGRALGMKPTLVTLDPSALAGEHKVATNDN